MSSVGLCFWDITKVARVVERDTQVTGSYLWGSQSMSPPAISQSFLVTVPFSQPDIASDKEALMAGILAVNDRIREKGWLSNCANDSRRNGSDSGPLSHLSMIRGAIMFSTATQHRSSAVALTVIPRFALFS